jgi:hypothetical protein
MSLSSTAKEGGRVIAPARFRLTIRRELSNPGGDLRVAKPRYASPKPRYASPITGPSPRPAAAWPRAAAARFQAFLVPRHWRPIVAIPASLYVQRLLLRPEDRYPDHHIAGGGHTFRAIEMNFATAS